MGSLLQCFPDENHLKTALGFDLLNGADEAEWSQVCYSMDIECLVYARMGACGESRRDAEFINYSVLYKIPTACRGTYEDFNNTATCLSPTNGENYVDVWGRCDPNGALQDLEYSEVPAPSEVYCETYTDIVNCYKTYV